MSKFVILHKKKDTLVQKCCIMKVTKQTFAAFRKEGVSRKYYNTSFFIHLQPVKKIKLMQKLLEPGNQSFHEYPGQYFYLRIPWKNHGLCQKQSLPQNYDCPFSQLRKMGWFTACRYLKIFCHWDYLFRSIAHRKTCFLHCGRYDSFQNKAFVTGSASNRRCVFPPVPFKRETGLWTPGGCCHAFL